MPEIMEFNFESIFGDTPKNKVTLDAYKSEQGLVIGTNQSQTNGKSAYFYTLNSCNIEIPDSKAIELRNMLNQLYPAT